MLTQMYVKAMVYLASLKNEEGQGMAEYGLILAIVAIAAIVGLQALGGELNTLFDGLGDTLATPAATPGE